ncbi:hypothetical protein HY218_02010 [Candidatus Saccharibacteria bacterium]|nr:hypothetical protein [Candidatus Saccharibacteria bacterium]
MARDTTKILTLPVSVIGQNDVGRLVREVKQLGEFLTQAAIREPGTPTKLPRSSRLMDELVQTNTLNPLIQNDRQWLMDFLLAVYQRAPVLHMSFNADPSPLFLQRLTTWLRREVHPLVLLSIGLQPNLGAGCTVRTKNKFFDFSLREYFKQKRAILVQEFLESDTP